MSVEAEPVNFIEQYSVAFERRDKDVAPSAFQQQSR